MCVERRHAPLVSHEPQRGGMFRRLMPNMPPLRGSRKVEGRIYKHAAPTELTEGVGVNFYAYKHPIPTGFMREKNIF